MDTEDRDGSEISWHLLWGSHKNIRKFPSSIWLPLRTDILAHHSTPLFPSSIRLSLSTAALAHHSPLNSTISLFLFESKEPKVEQQQEKKKMLYHLPSWTRRGSDTTLRCKRDLACLLPKSRRVILNTTSPLHSKNVNFLFHMAPVKNGCSSPPLYSPQLHYFPFPYGAR